MRRRCGVLVSVVALSIVPASAGGLLLYEVGTPDTGLASAGWAARAEDPGTVLTNPAGMSRLEGGDLLLGAQLLYGDLGFTADSDTTVSGGNGGNAVGWFPGGGAYYVRQLSDSVSFGFAAAGTFGLGLDYDDDWAGRYYVQEGALLGLSVLPAVSWKVSETISLGAALNATYGLFDTKVAINNVLPGSSDGSLAVDDTAWGLGANLGVLWEPNESSRFGLTYTSAVDLDFESRPEFDGLDPGLSAILEAAGLLDAELDLGVTIPQTAMTSFAHDLGSRWTILGNLGWQDWSEFGKVDVQVVSDDPSDLTIDQQFSDTWHAALGAQLHRGPGWSLRFGAAYDSSCVDDDNRSPTMPLGATWRFGVGAGKNLGDRMELGLNYELAWAGTMPLDQRRGPLAGTLSGEYADTALHFVSASLRWGL